MKICFLVLLTFHFAAASLSHDSGSMLELRGSLSLPNASWWSGEDPCKWEAVVCLDNRVSEIQFGARNVHGTLPDSLNKLSNLRIFDVQGNSLSGKLPPFSSLNSVLEKIYLNNNSFSGAIPETFADLPELRVLDVSFNNLSGQLPSFRKTVLVAYEGTRIVNDGSTGEADQNSDNKKTIPIALGTVGGVIVIGVALFLFIKMITKPAVAKTRVIRDRAGLTASETQGAAVGIGEEHDSMAISAEPCNMPIQIEPGTVAVSAEPDNMPIQIEPGTVAVSFEVLRNITNNFSEANVLGQGGFGTIYKGEYPDGTRIAVKRMVLQATSDRGLDEFHAEIAVLTKVRHRHLVSLLGYCVEGNERLLVYEYIAQGSLAKHLFDWEKENRTPLKWPTRLSIALDIARGVEYLHGLAHQTFVHRDLKPTNILLGDDMRAKVAAFGLVRTPPDGKMSFRTKLVGTFGYVAPEYATIGRVTTKVDVYSFGVILMELITGRKALDDSKPIDSESYQLIKWFRTMNTNQETFERAIDPVIEITQETLQSILSIAELAENCTQREPEQRPDMRYIVNVISSHAEIWKHAERVTEDIMSVDGIDAGMTLTQALERWKQMQSSSSADFASSSFVSGRDE